VAKLYWLRGQKTHPAGPIPPSCWAIREKEGSELSSLDPEDCWELAPIQMNVTLSPD
jgi:hypothetical protein